MFALCLLLTLAQDPPPPAAKPALETKEPPAAAPAVSAWSDQEAKQALAAFTAAMRGSPSMAEKSRALELLAPGAHAQLVKPLGKVAEGDKSIVVRKRAAELLAQQPPKQARPELLRLLRSEHCKGQPAVMASLVASLSRCDYQPNDWELIDGMFERDYGPDCVPLQEAILGLVADRREKRAVDLLLRNLDEPRPADVDDPANPPAEYWEARWKAWQVWRPRVKHALFSLTGQQFSTASEAKAWLRKNPLDRSR